MSVKWRKTSVKAQREAKTYAQQREDAAAIAFVVWRRAVTSTA